jgi:hypothetical protein
VAVRAAVRGGRAVAAPVAVRARVRGRTVVAAVAVRGRKVAVRASVPSRTVAGRVAVRAALSMPGVTGRAVAMPVLVTALVVAATLRSKSRRGDR